MSRIQSIVRWKVWAYLGLSGLKGLGQWDYFASLKKRLRSPARDFKVSLISLSNPGIDGTTVCGIDYGGVAKGLRGAAKFSPA